MRGFPKHLNSKQDFYNLINIYPKQTKEEAQKLLDNRIGWITTERLKDTKTGMINDTHRIDEIKDEEGNIVERYQVEYKEDPNARMFQLGFTVAEVEAIING